MFGTTCCDVLASTEVVLPSIDKERNHTKDAIYSRLTPPLGHSSVERDNQNSWFEVGKKLFHVIAFMTRSSQPAESRTSFDASVFENELW